ncbi:MAG: gamma-glutamylcyclotransferase (GGCT)/AIG2-like uncharacterized protein YtfP [Gammaproteobacteria bacterium]|jgi:gamma-glutamylcyclotransferase (GGCT)/AIG2-like uncharacterized protein YtfP
MLVFVYGTLKQGFCNHYYLAGAEYLGLYRTCESYGLYDFGNYPAVALDGEQAIGGEVFRISNEHLTALDVLEGYPDFYQRIKIETDYGQAWMYVVSEQLCSGKSKLSDDWNNS